jgi:hypothetical protein
VAGEHVPLRAGQRHDAYRDYLAALAAAPERILSYARGDQRQGREQRPARWLLDTLGALEGSGRRLYSRDLPGLARIPGYRVLPSFTAAVQADGEPMSLADRDLRSLLRWSESDRLSASALVDVLPVLRMGLDARRQRRSHAFGRFDGRIERSGIPSPTSGGALSPTSLESFAACPRRYLMERVLRIEVGDRPEDVLSISPSDRGTLIHAVLERFIATQLRLPRADRIRPDVPWSADDHARIDGIADAVFGEFEDRGLVGHPRLWNLHGATIRRELHRFLEADDGYRRRGGLVPERVELRFGPGHGAPVELSLGQGRAVRFKGSIDRVDMTEDGSVSLVDYKTGRKQNLDRIAADPLSGGQRLQLPLYALAARSALGGEEVRTAYWFVSDRGGFTLVEVPFDAALVDRLTQVVTVLVDGIEAGLFAARPGPQSTNCHFCQFEVMCPGDRQRSWDRVKGAPELAAYVELVERSATDEGDEAAR